MTKTSLTQNELFANLISKLRAFFEGNIYPAAIAAVVLIGHLTALEFYSFILVILAACIAFFVSDSVKPFIPTLLLFLYLVSYKHTPGYPSWSDYYSQTYVVVTAVIMFSLLFISAVYYMARRVVPKMHPKKTPLLLALTLLSAAFLMNGAFTKSWTPLNLLLGLAEAAVFFILFYLFYYGLEGENVNRLIDYLCYVALLSAIIIIVEMAAMFISVDGIISDGRILKENISLGWGISNPIGNALVILIPLLMLGAVKCKWAPVYLVTALLTCACTVLTLSRNAIIICVLIFTASFITVYIMSDSRKLLCSVLGGGVGIALVAALIFSGRIGELLQHFSLSGSDDSGRFRLWGIAFDNFLSAPIFGRGFFDFRNDAIGTDMVNFIPTMAHNTVLQLMSSMGIFGLGTYVYYRVKSTLPFFKRISREKLMLFYSVAALILGSLLDNFIFYFHGPFLYVVVLALVFRMNDYEEEWIRCHADDDDEYESEDEDEDDSDGDDDYYI
ncbi:MAG: O-antigen ligase family protein [Clostridia bacterium]|nr:O-antigen ligase family protein [Clostridia bacterium]